MAQRKKIIKTKINSTPMAMSNLQRQQLQGQVSKAALSEVQKTINRQEEIDDYNFNTCNIIDPHFEQIQLVGAKMIIRLHKENYIKGIEMFLPDGTPVFDHWISQVDGRLKQTHAEKWVDNPLPYVHSGVIVAIAPSAVAYFSKEKKALEELNSPLAASYKIPEVGDIITMEHFSFADNRYYKNKQARDFIRNPEEFSINNWEGYVSVHPAKLESIIKDKKAFEMTSAYKAYKNSQENA